MTTALDHITGAARLIGVAYKGEALSADEAADGLAALNDMLASWSNDDLLTYAYEWNNFSLTAGVASYLMGEGQTFNDTRPINIAAAFVRSGSTDYQLQLISPEQYELEIPVKTVSSTIPQYLSYDNAYPYPTIRIYPVPATNNSLYMLYNKPLETIASLDTTVDLPPGWNRAIKYNLAIEMAPEFGQEPSASVVDTARKSLGAIKRATSANNAMPLMFKDGLKYSVITGTP